MINEVTNVGVLTDNAALEEQERVRVAHIHLPPHQVPRKDRVLRRSSMQENQQRPLASKVCNEEIEETVDDECLRSSRRV